MLGFYNIEKVAGRGVIVVLIGMWPAVAAPVFYRDVLPILQNRCQSCHRPGQIGKISFLTYEQTRPWAKAIREAVRARKMPPWFADPCCGRFANDRSLSATEIETLTGWVEAGAAKGDERDAPAVRRWPAQGNLESPDVTLTMPQAFDIQAKGAVEYQYFAVPTGFREDRWVQAVETIPGAPEVVHHAVVYIREPGSTWTRGPTKADILTVYAPGGSPDRWPDGMAKLVKAGSDLVFEIHYTPNGKAVKDRTRVALEFSKSAPEMRVLTLQMANEKFVIPPRDRDYRVNVWGTLPNDALLLGFFPHMHLRGKAFEFTRIRDDGQPETLLRVRPYDFYWQLSYRLEKPIALKKGTRLEWIGWFDNSSNNARNPDPSAEVRYGQQSWEEMMIGFFDVAVGRGVDKGAFFGR
jgi:Copper type II ascorbate-dependent monooxygenase, C-terminal domain